MTEALSHVGGAVIPINALLHAETRSKALTLNGDNKVRMVSSMQCD